MNISWCGWPPLAILVQSLTKQTTPSTVIIMADHWHSYDRAAIPNCLAGLRQAASYYQQQPVLCIPLDHGSRLLLVRPNVYAAWLQAQQHEVINSVDALKSSASLTPIKPWLVQPATNLPTTVVIIGAGIAGAATAYALAQRHVRVIVLDKNDVAMAASGNHQGLLYAKISAHDTVQTELLLAGYGYSQALLTQTLPTQHGWQACGVLHLDYNQSEYQRNQTLAQQTPSSTLYQYVNIHQASQLAGITVPYGGLWWPHGIALNPRLWCLALLKHPLISVYTHSQVTHLEHHHDQWWIDYQSQQHRQQLKASHIVLCMGADSDTLAPTLHWPFQFIRGQTTTVTINSHTITPQCALSANSYIAPAWDNQLCFGASFHPNNRTDQLTYADQYDNQQQLHSWLPQVSQHLPPLSQLQGHAAVRCDAYDHLPVVGAIGQESAMRQIYAKLALDKNHRLYTPCPWLPGVYINTAHGSRGLTTAPLCAEAIACAILGLPSPLSARLQQALHPNRLIIRSISHHLPWHDT